MRDLQNLIADLNSRHIAVEFVKEHLNFTGEDSPMSKLMLSILGGFADFDRSLIREASTRGIAAAKQRGVYRGRRRSLTPAQVTEIRTRAAARESKTTLANEFNLSRQTLYQALRSDYIG